MDDSEEQEINNTTKSCPIWGTAAEIENHPENRGVIVDSPRSGGKYLIFEETIPKVRTLTDNKKARLTSWLIKRRSEGDRCPEIDGKRISDEDYGQDLSVSKRADGLLKVLGLESSSIGEEVVISSGPPDYVYEKMLAHSESINNNEIFLLLDRLKKYGLISIDLSGETATLEMEGYDYLEELQRSAPDSSETSMAMCFDQPLPKATRDQVEKAKKKLGEGDYAGAITNCYTLAEELLKELLKKTGTTYSQNEGDIKKLYRQLSGPLNLNPKGKNLESYLKSILQGLQQQMDGLYHLANKTGDRHAQLYEPARRHAKLAVNTTLAFCEFLLESHEYQKKQVQF